MAKKQSFAEKSAAKSNTSSCPVCAETIQHVKYTKSIKTDAGAWKLRTSNIGVCKCNHAEIYG